MGLHDRLHRQNGSGNGQAPETFDALAGGQPEPVERRPDPYADLKTRIHHACIAKLGPQLYSAGKSQDGPPEDLAEKVQRVVTEQLALDRPALTPEAAQFLSACVRGKLNVLSAGGTGTGKTTTLNALSAFVPNDERIVTIEDAAELQLQQQHVITLEARPANIEGEGEIRIRELVRNALRMRPDRIIVGEVRGPETLDMLQAMNTGHEGSLTTIHANSPRDALSRLETLVMTGGVELPHRAIREQIASAFDVLVQIQRLVDGSRRISHISEVVGMESDVITLQDIFVALPPGEDDAAEARRLLAPLRATGLKPHFLDKLAANNVALAPTFFAEEDTDVRAAFSVAG